MIYVGALAFLATGLQSVLATLATLIKFYPQTRTATELIQRLKNAGRLETDLPNPPANIHVSAKPRIAGSERRRRMARGDLAVLLTKTQLRRLSLQEVMAPLRRASDAPPAFWNTAAFLAYAESLPSGTVAESVLGNDKSESARTWLEAFLAQALGDSYKTLLPKGLETRLAEERWDLLSPCEKSALALAGACAEAHGVLFLDVGIAEKLPNDIIRDLPRTRDIQYVFIVSSKVNLSLQADHYVVANEKAIIGLGSASWVETQRETIAPLVTRTQGEAYSDDLLDEDF